jgi:hypothetical protein
MSSLFGRQQTPEEIKEVRQARKMYQDYLSTTQTKTNTDVNRKAITPESGQAILKEIEAGQIWLEKHPNANYNELLTNQDTVTVEINRIMKTDAPKRKLKNILLSLPVIAANGVLKKILTDDQAEKLNGLAADEEKWYSKNSASATEIQFSQEELKINDSIQNLLVNGNEVNYVRDALQNLAGRDTSELQAYLATQESVIKAAKSRQVDIQEGARVAGNTALKVFGYCILIVFCILAGSIAANLTIGRSPAYRVTSFIYGSFPLFAPFMLLYAIYKRLRYGPFTLYAILPLSVEPAVSRLGRLLWYPFYWIPDQDSINAMNQYTESLSKAVVTA